MDWMGSYNTAKGMYGEAQTGANIGRDIATAGKSALSWLGLKEGGIVSMAQAGSFATVAPKYSLMPIKDRVVMMKEGGVVPTFMLKNYPYNRDSDRILAFQKQNMVQLQFGGYAKK